MRKLIGSALGLALMVSGGSALASGDRSRAIGGHQFDFAKIDQDDDGTLSVAELAAAGAARIAAADADRDGKLSTAEVVEAEVRRFREIAEARVKDRFARMDADHDGFLTQAEAGPPGGAEGLLKQLDRDGDGALSKEELMRRRGEGWREMPGRHRDGMPGRHPDGVPGLSVAPMPGSAPDAMGDPRNQWPRLTPPHAMETPAAPSPVAP
ncbi:EF-hand domain-containing protein [Cereibacter sphaeroides]|uniref:EF-hand domain-containing protein n=1 Tax=Cereibacter sphaeroides TaxID=1063 RepID=UPI001F3E4D0C|nr:EF-hand domain-containing protein [Cereibacter sphaeroides]MCE6959329.1 EF-hand domain-containing protein [Cereibacter sphaeroides]MCE6972921.1 EF-hand domain-containing protein [Cereibacter sphaeroides]